MDVNKLRVHVDHRQRSESGPPSVLEALSLSAKADNPLLLPELFQNVLDCFRPTVEIVDRQTLVALALTCRILSSPSLDRLWRKLFSLKPLILCYTTLDEFEHEVPPTPSQFAVIDSYSRRVRELTISENTSVRFLQCTSTRSSLLLPQLTILRWSPYVLKPHIPIIFINQLLSPTLVSLEATLAEEDGPMLLSFFDKYPRSCQDLKSIEFRFSIPPQSEVTICALSRATHQGTLESVAVHARVDQSALRHLCTLPTLKLLSVHLPEKPGSQSSSLFPTSPLLCNVEELELTTANLDHVTALLRPQEQIFHTLRLFHRGRQTSQAFSTFLEVLTSRSTETPLRKLTLSIGDISQPVPADRMLSEAILYRLSFKTLQPLMVLNSLRELMIEWSEQISLDDQELGNLARSWPSLRVFNIYCGRGGYPPYSAKYPTLLGLLSLVNSCPKLCTVSLPLDARRVPEVMEEEVHTTDFACLIVPESPIDEPLPVAEFLCKHLPSVTAVDARFLRVPGSDAQQIIAYEQAWQQVDLHLEEFYNSSLDAWGEEPELDSDLGSDWDM